MVTRLDEPLPPELRITYEDYCALPDNGKRYEVIEGRLYMTPSPAARHQRVAHRLISLLDRYLDEHPVGELFLAPFDVVLSPTDVVQPDLLFIARERAAIVTDKNVQGAPDLVVEVVSPSSSHRDLVLKRKLYGTAGVREFWVIDPEADRVEVFRPEGATLARVATLDAGDPLTSPLFPGLTVDLTGLLAR